MSLTEPRLISLGSILVDEIFRIPHLPPRSGDVIASENYRLVGGGLNILVSARRLGLLSAYAGALGSGPNSEAIQSALREEDIAVLTSPRGNKDSGVSLTLLEPDGTRTFVTYPGAEAEPALTDLARVSLTPDDFIYISGYDLGYPIAGPVLERFMDEYIRDQRIIFDPGPLIADIPGSLLEKILGKAEVTSCNSDEYQYLVTTGQLAHVQKSLVVRDGSNGVDVVTQGSSRHISAPIVTAVDSTGAGDTHVGAMIAELAEGADLRAAVYFANICAAISVTRYGPAVGPTRAEVSASGLYDARGFK